jgi:predicted ATPase
MQPTAASTAPGANAAPWQIRLLGRVQADGPSGSITRWPSRACAALIARLALNPTRVHPREELVELLWPGVPPDSGRARLRQTLSNLRGLLEPAGGTQPALLLADRQTLRLNAGALDCDVLRFERLLAAGEHEAARALYQGDLMPGFYEDWVVTERQRFEALCERLPPAPAPAGAVQAVAISLPASMAAPPVGGRLPAYWTRAFGLDEALPELCASVQAHRLLTLVGPGGNGKTRLAVAAAQALSAAAPGASASVFGNVIFAPMFDVVQPQQLWPTLALLLAASGSGDARAQVATLLTRQTTLLVLDNVEQFDADCAHALAALLQDVPTLHLLLTSRRRLGLPGECVHELPGLPLPLPLLPLDTQAGMAVDASIERVQGNSAVSLFIDRARESRPEFRLSAQTAPAVVGLVRLLGGMPLAIELAASRLRALGPRELLARLSQDAGTPLLDLLARPGAASGKLSALSRHASMRHVMAWSWQQLSPDLASLLQAMAIFAQPASATLIAQAWAGLLDADLDAGADADAGIADTSENSTEDRTAPVLALLADALEASLVTRSGPAEGPGQDDAPARYTLLQPVREFAAERNSPQQTAAARTRLRRWLIGFARRCATQRHLAIAQVQAELPQICAAIMQGVDDGAYTEAAQLAVALRRHWEIDTRAAPPVAVVQALRTAQPHLVDGDLLCQTCLLLCISMLLAGDVGAARGYASTALAAAPDQRLRAQALMRLAGPQLFAKPPDPSLDDTLAQAIALARQAGDVETEALAMRMQFLLVSNRDRNYLRAEELAQGVQALWQSLGHSRNAYSALMDRASCWTQRKLFAQAVPALETCERVAREERFATGYIMASWQLGRALLPLRRGGEALAAFQRCLRDSWHDQRMAYVADALLLTPGGLALSGRFDQAAVLQGFATAHWQQHFGAFYPEIKRDVCFTRRVLRQVLGPARLDSLRLQGTGLTLAQAVSLGLSVG